MRAGVSEMHAEKGVGAGCCPSGSGGERQGANRRNSQELRRFGAIHRSIYDELKALKKCDLLHVMDLLIRLVLFGGAIGAVALMVSERRRVTTGSDARPLEGNTKAFVWITCLLSPVLSGIIYYYGWKGRLPIMAKQANRITFIAIIPWIVGFFLLFLLPGIQEGLSTAG
ncbi:hypothetical protein HY969_04155 [Candidatus Kaiserbacteria bacterium]|nr:hypothetical protein [Candidatus Kaiserbacteria bacterium]